MKFGIVVTTIYDGSFLDEYYDHFQTFGGLEKVNFYVVGDLSTPASCRANVEKYTQQGLPWYYLGREEQEKFLQPFPQLAAQIPWKTDNRRNVGFLMAYRDGCDTIIAIDDDNYPKAQWSFLKGHSTVGKKVSLPTAVGHNKWFNLCSLMQVASPSLGGGQTVYARGFPYKRRHLNCSQIDSEVSTGIVGISAGLWSGDPDVDAATRIVTCCHAEEKFNGDYLLGSNTLMPINTQNTALIREAIPAYYYVKMGHPIKGMKLDRFGDIFSGFFVQKCAQAVGHRVKIGSPVVEHRRSPHNLYKDLWHELAGMVAIDDMTELLETPLSPTSSYGDAALELGERLREWSASQQGFIWDQSLRDYFGNVANNISLWVTTCESLNSQVDEVLDQQVKINFPAIKPKISLVTTVLNDFQGCQAFFQQMEAQTMLPEEIVIVDGGSKDGTWEFLQAYQTTKAYSLKVIQDIGCNVARGRNIAIAKSSYDLIVSTDVGCIWEPQWLAELAHPLLDNPEIDAVMGSWKVRWQDLTGNWAKVEYALLAQPQAIATPTSHASSRAISYRKSLWSKIGGYPEDLTLAGDDMVFALLLHQATDKVACAPVPRCYWERPVTLQSFCKEARRNFFGGGEAGIWLKHGLLVGTRLIVEFLLLTVVCCSLLLAKPIGISLLLLALFSLSFIHRLIRLLPAIDYLQDFSYFDRWRRIILFEYATKFWGIMGYWRGFLTGARHCTQCRERLSSL